VLTGCFVSDGVLVEKPTPAVADDGVAAVAAGYEHGCAVLESGALHCWGRNARGQLGDGTSDSRGAPVAIGSGPFVAVSAGGEHTCAIHQDGSLFCWGANEGGQLGDGSYDDAWTPQPIHPGPWRAVSLGSIHSCGLHEDGSLWCWGANFNGELGLGYEGGWAETPTRVGTASYAAVAAGAYHTCAVRQGGDGLLECWGHNAYGQLGDGTIQSRTQPTPIAAAAQGGWSAVSAGARFSCGIRNGEAWCWGDNTYGQLGGGSFGGSMSPSRVSLGDKGARVAAGSAHACALTTEGGLHCWGANYARQLGVGPMPVLAAEPLPIDGSWLDVAAGGYHGCAVRVDRSLWCWGSQELGQAAAGVVSGATKPTGLDGSTWMSVSVGPTHSCALTSLGSLSCWGANGVGQLGSKLGAAKDAPEAVEASDWIQISVGFDHSCAIRNEGSLWCWGSDYEGQVSGTPSRSWVADYPKKFPVDTAWANVSAGATHTCAIDKSGMLLCWGDNSSGQLSAGATGPHGEVAVSGSWKRVSAGAGRTCAIDASAKLWCWGWDAKRAKASPAPSEVKEAGAWADLSVGVDHACAIDTDGALWCWGSNSLDKLGDGSGDDHLGEPVQVAGRVGWTAVFAGADHTCGVRAGALFCWGGNLRGQLGADFPASRQVPTRVFWPESLSALASGGSAYHACGIDDGGMLWCWGAHEQGQLGIGKAWTDLPTQVALGAR
jgi:alpha-tubulin suppressor-like RCC1 family protein